ncbi:MAG: hypothetical protein PHI97_01985 [Desulfobulbus sp.]|nr:hypothetical protein [Desulfobulbus sp.]
MDPAALLPTLEAIPVPWGWFQALLLLTFLIHILLMNAMFGSAFIALVSHFRRSGSTTPCSESVSQTLPFIIAFTVNFGVAPLLFVQVLYGHLLYTSSILMAVYWLAVIGLLIGAYSLSYLYKYRYPKLGLLRIPILILIVAFFAAIAFVFVNNIGMMQSPASWGRYFEEPRGLLLNLQDPMQLPRYLHFLLSSLAVGGLVIAGYSYRQQQHGDWAGMDWIQIGCRWFSFATMVNILVGLWFLFSLPRGTLNLAHSSGQILAALTGAGLLLAIPALRAGLAGRVVSAIWWTLGTVILMVLVRDQLRRTLIAPWFSPTQLQVEPSFTPLILFLLLCVLGMGVIAWMVPFTLKNCGLKGGRS